MSELSELRAVEGETEFSHIPDWYEWERSNVRKEVEAGTYAFTCRARVDALPNAKGYMDLGMATLTHDMTGFTVDGSYKGEDYHVHIPAASQYSVHIEYEYLGKYGDCVDLNTDQDTLYVYPKDMGFYLGFGGALTFKNAKKNVEVAAKAPLDRLVVETDCPYMAPVPFRGKRNDPTKTLFILQKLAELRAMAPEDLAPILFENGQRLFSIR